MMITLRVLFVCYENICRSPMAEGVFRAISGSAARGMHFEVCSAGTVACQIGSPPDCRSVRTAGRHGIDISSIRAQCIDDLDLHRFDWIFVMDCENYRDVMNAVNYVSSAQIHMVTDFSSDDRGTDIDDPYYGPEQDFELVYERLRDAVTGFLDFLYAESSCGFETIDVR
jgi:protein-tyrosine phosphatase